MTRPRSVTPPRTASQGPTAGRCACGCCCGRGCGRLFFRRSCCRKDNECHLPQHPPWPQCPHARPRALPSLTRPHSLTPFTLGRFFDDKYRECQREFKNHLIASTCIAAMLSTFLMGLFARMPLAVAPAMGVNAYVSG